MILPVNELFETIQGEGSHTGTPAVFVRIQGCEVGCPWCDTKHSWSVKPEREVSQAHILGKQGSDDAFAWFADEALVHAVLAHRARHVVITGGEPCAYDLLGFTTALIDRGCSVQIETSGTYAVIADADSWVTVSPKIGMQGGREVLGEAIDRADEIKMPVGKPDDIDALVLVLALRRRVPLPAVFVQPLSLSEKATRLCVEAATANGWRVSVQTHKLIGVR